MEKRILRLKEVMHKTGLARSTIYKEIKRGKFPGQFKLNRKSVGWSLADIEQWMDNVVHKETA